MKRALIIVIAIGMLWLLPYLLPRFGAALKLSTTATSTFPNGINLTTGCLTYAGGSCIATSSSVTTLYRNNNVGLSSSSNTATTSSAAATYVMPANTLDTARGLEIVGMWSTPNSMPDYCYADLEFGNGTATSTLGFFAVGSNNSAIRLQATMTATSSTAQMFAGIFSSVRADGTGLSPTTGAAGRFTGYNLAATTYFSFSVRSQGGGQNCAFNAGSITLLPA